MVTSQEPDLDTLSSLLRTVASEQLMPRFGRLSSREKADGSLVTEADLAVQQALISRLGAHWPSIPLLGEEMSADEQAKLLANDGPGLWCLDPLDGTSNFTCGFPGFCISLALLRGGNVVLGAVLDPVRDECFTAKHGAGAWLNGKPLHPYAPGERLQDCIAIVDFKRLPSSKLGGLFGPDSFRSQRNLGAVALEWCWLGAGRFQLYLHGGQGLWDHAAGRLVARESGAITALFKRGSSVPEPQLGLDKRVALGAATAPLFKLWEAKVGLPLTE